jgi:hypothetical protein
MPSVPFDDDLRRFVDSTRWTFAKTYAATWPHEYVVKTPRMRRCSSRWRATTFEHDVDGRVSSQVRKYHHESGKVYSSMDDSPESTTLVNRCSEDQTYEARLAAGTLTGRLSPE